MVVAALWAVLEGRGPLWWTNVGCGGTDKKSWSMRLIGCDFSEEDALCSGCGRPILAKVGDGVAKRKIAMKP